MFVSQDMRNWKRCYGTTVRDNKLMQHQVSLQLADCVDAYAQYQTVKSGCFQSVAELKNSAHAKLISENRICLRTVCEVLLSLLNGKLPNMRPVDHFELMISIKTHHTVQNALLDIMKDMFLGQIKQELHDAEYFTILADESKDTSIKEQVVVAVRYCYKNTIHEEFIGVSEAYGLDANGLSDTVIRQFGRVDANMNRYVGQGYDGASVFSGHLNGILKKIPQKTGSEMAYYIHFFCHRLSLVIVDVVNSVKCGPI